MIKNGTFSQIITLAWRFLSWNIVNCVFFVYFIIFWLLSVDFENEMKLVALGQYTIRILSIKKTIINYSKKKEAKAHTRIYKE